MPGALIATPLRPARDQRLGGGMKRGKVRRRRHLPGLLVKEQCRKGGDAREAAAVHGVDSIGHGRHVRRIEAALMAAVEGVALVLDAGEHRLGAAGARGRSRRLAGLLVVEDGPEIGREGRCRLGFGARDLDEMAEVADPHPGAVRRAHALHVNVDRRLRCRRA